jgi:hypothetical protein
MLSDHRKIYLKQWRTTNRRRINVYNNAWKKANPNKANATNARHRARHPEKYRARRALNYQLEIGTITRKPCEICGAKAQAHHEDYSKPLDVRWLCPKHHMKLHNAVAV